MDSVFEGYFGYAMRTVREHFRDFNTIEKRQVFSDSLELLEQCVEEERFLDKQFMQNFLVCMSLILDLGEEHFSEDDGLRLVECGEQFKTFTENRVSSSLN